MYKFTSHIDLMIDFVSKKKNPIILEFGVERGSSTKKFIKFAEKNLAKVYSVDIVDYSNVSNSNNWRFIQSNDLNIDYVLSKFDEIKTHGADLIFIDSYHEDVHVQKLIFNYFPYLKQDGAIFVDDVDSLALRLKKNTFSSIVYDLTLESVKEFYYNNLEKCSLKIIYDKNENGLAMLHKSANFGTKPNPIKKIWNYNILIKIIYPYLKKLVKSLKSIFN